MHITEEASSCLAPRSISPHPLLPLVPRNPLNLPPPHPPPPPRVPRVCYGRWGNSTAPTLLYLLLKNFKLFLPFPITIYRAAAQISKYHKYQAYSLYYTLDISCYDQMSSSQNALFAQKNVLSPNFFKVSARLSSHKDIRGSDATTFNLTRLHLILYSIFFSSSFARPRVQFPLYRKYSLNLWTNIEVTLHYVKNIQRTEKSGIVQIWLWRPKFRLSRDLSFLGFSDAIVFYTIRNC